MLRALRRVVIPVAVVTGACVWMLAGQRPGPQSGAIYKIRHVIVIMQENRSFDSYFGTYPGADGIPMRDGEPAVCVNDPATNQCVKPYHDAHDSNGGGPHSGRSAVADVDGGKMRLYRASRAGDQGLPGS